ncbi:hypothetical protein AVEN_274923-1 [Araneus ventricosus]|uniref:Uncharacterized protein n=1 Tax=Araneus ventricosus TaxID=182803 RepID=A0A4Y2W270_ARAVE|nr:hypothetical protein AVEN_274923-1 [Araneus ventricosus]
MDNEEEISVYRQYAADGLSSDDFGAYNTLFNKPRRGRWDSFNVATLDAPAPHSLLKYSPSVFPGSAPCDFPVLFEVHGQSCGVPTL